MYNIISKLFLYTTHFQHKDSTYNIHVHKQSKQKKVLTYIAVWLQAPVHLHFDLQQIYTPSSLSNKEK